MNKKDWKKSILCDDSRNVIKRIPDNSIDLILTDPPYNIGKHSTGNIPLPGRAPMNNDVAKWDWVDFFPEEWAEEFIRILKPTGNLFIFTSYNQIGKWYNVLDHRFDTSNFMVWHKTNPAPKIFKAGFLNSCEMIFTCWNKGHTWNFISQAEMHNFFESPICMKPERLSNPKHPAQKPVALLEKILSIASNPGDVVFDPFMGVGSTGVAALNLQRKFIGVEIDPQYFNAAKLRLDSILQKQEANSGVVEDSSVAYQRRVRNCNTSPFLEERTLFSELFALENLLNDDAQKSVAEPERLKPLIKWAGGKEKELMYILPNLPAYYENYYEPFVGGGAVYMAMQAKRYYINDFSAELISLYRCVAFHDNSFFNYVEQINATWDCTLDFFKKHQSLINLYLEYRGDVISDKQLKQRVQEFCADNKEEIISLLGIDFNMHHEVILDEMFKNLFRKLKRMKVLELSKHLLPEEDLAKNVETAIKGAYYMYYRCLYNDKDITKLDNALHCALFYFIRNYCYSGMFRYNSDGEFNVPYGGIAYNSKSMRKQIDYYCSKGLLDHLSSSTIDNEDFETFLRRRNPQENDFIFLDPPYDSEFSTYAQKEFTKADQCRLSKYLIEDCKAKWMLVIKNTEFIYNLYNRPGVNIRSFDKEYVVSFMNRNNKKTTHLLITNY